LSTACPVCGSPDLVDIIDLGDVPLFCNVQWPSRAQALMVASAPMQLVGCPSCGHHFNAAFEPDRLQYAPAYDTSQHFSATFRAYAESLAARLINAYGVNGKAVVDVGCGKGDLLKLICRLGGNRGFGFDVSYEEDANPSDAPGVTFRNTFFDAAQSADIAPALVCCRHVLEHVADPVSFLRGLGQALGGHTDRVLYVEVPNGAMQLSAGLLWDYIYEHYSYFSAESLRHALVAAGFEILRLEPSFGDQFLCADVRLRASDTQDRPGHRADLARKQMRQAAARFTQILEHWRRWAAALPQHEESTVLWGAGSKGVTFVNLLGLTAPVPIERMIDQNPNKHGRFVARTGQIIAPPDSLIGRPVKTVLLMNDIYRNEVSRWLDEHAVQTSVISAMSQFTEAETSA